MVIGEAAVPGRGSRARAWFDQARPAAGAVAAMNFQARPPGTPSAYTAVGEQKFG